MKFIDDLLSFLNGNKKEDIAVEEIKPNDKPVDVPKFENEILSLSKIGLDISQSFEGDIPYANPTGDGPPAGFDGMGLTMGALGWTFGYGDQQRLVKKYISSFGKDAFLSKMSKCGDEYLKFVYMPTKQGTESIRDWSRNEKVIEPYRSDLINFWTCKEMIDIQIDEAASNMGLYSDKMTKDLSQYVPNINYRHSFLWFFDVRVMNGSMKSAWIDDVKNLCGGLSSNQLEKGIHIAFKDISSWAGHDSRFLNKNMMLWSSMHTNDLQKVLMLLGYERSKLARNQFRLATMFRRGTLAFGKGYVNGQPRNFQVELGLEVV